MEKLCKSAGRIVSMNVWESITSHLSGKISAEAYQNWLSKTVFLKTEEARLWVGVPDPVTRDWILQEYAAEIWAGVRELKLPFEEIVYQVESSPSRPAFE